MSSKSAPRSFRPQTSKGKSKEPKFVVNPDGSISVIHQNEEEKFTIGDFSFPRYQGTEFEFQVPFYHQLSSNAKEVINNLYYAQKKKDIQRCVAALKALCIIIEGEGKFYCLWTGKARGIYSTWAQMSKQLKEGRHEFAKANSLEDALITFQGRGIKSLEEIVIPGAYQKQALEIWGSFPSCQDQETLLKQTGVQLKMRQLEEENNRLQEENKKLLLENEEVKAKLDSIYEEAESMAYQRFTRSETGILANNVGLVREKVEELFELFLIHDKAPNKTWIQSIREAMQDDGSSSASERCEEVPTENGDNE